MRDLFEYINYRRYLADYYRSRKEELPAFSYRYFCNKAGIKSPVFLKQVIEGQRNLTAAMTRKFCKGLGLRGKEARFFSTLVRFNQAKSASEKQQQYAILRTMMTMVSEKCIPPNLFDYFSKWYHPVVRELVCLAPFGDDYKRLASTAIPPLTEHQARNSVAFLLRNGLLDRRADGTWVQRDQALATADEIASIALRNFHRHMLELAQAALDRIPRNQRHISGVTLSCSPELYDAVAAEIAAFKQQIVTLVNKNSSTHDRIYQLNIQLFPVSGSVKDLPGARDTKESPDGSSS